MWPYFSEDDEEVTRAVYTIENPFHENFQDLSEFSSELRISDHVFEIQVRNKPGASVKQPRAERPKTVEIVDPVDPRSLKTNSRIINSKTPSTPAGKQSTAVPPRSQPESNGKANATTSKPNATTSKPNVTTSKANVTTNKPADANPPRPTDPSRRPRLDDSISYSSPLQNSHQNTKSSSGWNQPPASAKSTANAIRPNPANYQPDYRSNVFRQPAPMSGLSQPAASHRPYSSFAASSNSNLVTIQTDQRSPTDGGARRPWPPQPRLAFGNLGQPMDIRIGTNQSGNFQCRNINYNSNFDPRKPPPIRNSACALDPRMQNNYRAAPKPAQIAANDPRVRANRTEASESIDQLQADANKRREQLQRKEEELRRKELEIAIKERELETAIGTNQRRSGSDAYAPSITGNDRAIFSIAEFQKSQTSSFEEDVRPKKSDYEALSEILKTIKEKTPDKEKAPDKEKESTKNGLPIVLDTANSVAGGAPKPAGSTGTSRRVTMVRSNQPAAVEPSKKIRLDHPYSKSDAVNTDSDDSVIGSPVSTDTADTTEMEIDPAIESIISSKIDAAMRRSDDQDGTDLEAKLRKLLE